MQDVLVTSDTVENPNVRSLYLRSMRRSFLRDQRFDVEVRFAVVVRTVPVCHEASRSP